MPPTAPSAPTTTIAATTFPPFALNDTTSVQIDVMFDVFADSRVNEYLQTIADIAAIPVTRLRVQYYGNVPSLEFGTKYIFTVLVAYDALAADHQVVAATKLVWALNGAAATAEPLLQRTIRSAAIVFPEPRAEEAILVGVNYTWIAFLMIAVGMMGVSAMIMMRTRSANESEQPSAAQAAGGADERQAQDAVADTAYVQELDQNVDNTVSRHKLIQRAVDAQERARRDAAERTRYAPTEKLFAATLEHHRYLHLPPQYSGADVLRYPIAPTISITGTAAPAKNPMDGGADSDTRSNATSAVSVSTAADGSPSSTVGRSSAGLLRAPEMVLGKATNDSPDARVPAGGSAGSLSPLRASTNDSSLLAARRPTLRERYNQMLAEDDDL